MFPETPPCPDCGEATKQIHLPKAVNWNAPPVIVYQAPDGSVRFPGAAESTSTKQYDKQGYKRIEIRGAAEMRRFEGSMEKVEFSRAQRRVEHLQAQREASNSRRASDIRHGLEQGFRIPERDDKGRPTGRLQTVRLSARGRDIMRAAQQTGENRAKHSFSGANFHNEAYSFDRSNRDESRGPDGRRRRD